MLEKHFRLILSLCLGGLLLTGGILLFAYLHSLPPPPPKPVASLLETTETITEKEGFIHSRKEKKLPSGSVFWTDKLVFTQEKQEELVFFIQGTVGTVRYVNSDGEWEEKPLDGRLPRAVLHIDTDREHWIVSPPTTYTPFENHSLEEDSTAARVPFANKTPEGFNLSLPLQGKGGQEGQLWVLRSTDNINDFEEAEADIWRRCNNLEKHRYTYDGYYGKTPSTYEPYSETMYWRNPAAFAQVLLAREGRSQGAQELAYAMLETVIDNQEPDGYWLTLPISRDNLWENYWIESGFYDTRFNADLTEALYLIYEKTGDKKFLAAAEKQTNFYLSYAENNHYLFEEQGQKGWLVFDYKHFTERFHKPTHTSLNHQLQEINTLYIAYVSTKNMSYLDTADKLLWGIKLTRDKWVKPNRGGLEYAYMYDGTMGLQDYPYLTYDDLLKTQYLRRRVGLAPDPDLDYLIEKKLEHMEYVGITGYKTPEDFLEKTNP